ncbi:MAG: YtxH domain-containing protein [Herpetosiphonaceae bacterium]|nr:YtxH domain-containing protein [Herpetosiphonaceae bacterium]
MKVIGTILRWFVLGAVAGLLIAPRAGHETRELIGEKFTQLVDGLENGSSADAA